ncbi:Galactose-binding domain-like [Trinorchestia longiramus]|nr:Galactose-binding domain-like [Trinorchestia longiramus]
MELNILAWILLTWFWPLNSAETLPKFNTASGHNCWLSTLSTLSFSAVSELLCSMRCRTTGSHSFMYENGSCEILETYWPAEDIVMYKEYDNTTEREVAKNKPVSASPNYGSDFPPRAVDGDATTFYHSANNEKTPWFMVDLGGGFLVSKVRVLPRPYLDDTHRFVDTQVLVDLGLHGLVFGVPIKRDKEEEEEEEEKEKEEEEEKEKEEED